MAKKKRKNNKTKHKIISIVITIALIIGIIVIAFGSAIKTSIENGDEIDARWFLGLIYPDKYAYSREMADLNEYFQLFGASDVAIIVGNERIEDRGTYQNGAVYFPLSTAERLFTDRFYYNSEEGKLLYSTSTDIYTVDLNDGSQGYTYEGNFTSTDHRLAFVQGEELYISLDYVRKFANFQYTFYPEPNRVQVYTNWDSELVAELVKPTSIRYQGGIKSDVLRKAEKGEIVTVLEPMETWTKIHTADGFTGYVENTKLGEAYSQAGTPVNDAYNPMADYGSGNADDSIILAWHQIYYADKGENLNSFLDGSEGVTVVSPTWFYINSSSGTFDNYATKDYVDNAHNKGYKVWALVEDMTNAKNYSEYELFSSSANRKALINNLVNAVIEVGADGINVDCEYVNKETGEHFVQFLRELSIETRKNGLVLSVDGYVQNQGNLYYDLREQGIVADYVVIMGYDEHWAGSEPGSVASIGFVEGGIQSALNSGVPSSKLINGVPFYTRLYRTEGADVSSQAIGMDEAQNWMANRGISPTWDDVACQYYIKFEDGTAVSEMFVEDKESMEARLSMMKGYNLAGVACWKLGLENKDIWSVLNSYY
ncbi:MAG: glycosyl hydrolase family 18 protein [Lachnospiraceae bacterium]|nr:glycosyl hydrolase family 18 protein [Lachnospiraceae bacterium]